jgi:hypothetical protein
MAFKGMGNHPTGYWAAISIVRSQLLESTTITSSESSADSIQAAMSNSSLWVRMKIENITAIFPIYLQNCGARINAESVKKSSVDE